MALHGDIAHSFKDHYFRIAANGAQDELAKFYRPESTVTWDGKEIQGTDSILQQLSQLKGAQHQVRTVDSQPAPGPDGSILVVVDGILDFEGSGEGARFTQTFILTPNPDQRDSRFVSHQIFRAGH